MRDHFGSDFTTIIDEDGTVYELEILATLEYGDSSYLAVLPAGLDEDEEAEVFILKSIIEDGEPILVAIEDQQELEIVNNLMMEQLYEEEE